MPLKPLFGTLNATVAKTIVKNSPKYRKIVEPFADGGTLALTVQKRKPKEHTVNILDENLFAAMTFAQTYTSGDFRQLKSYDWISSQETFDAVRKISAIEGAEHFYKFWYSKKFGMSMDPEAEPEWDILSVGKDLKPTLFALPLMRALLKGATITNDEPMSLVNGGDAFLILLPKKPEDVQAVEGRLSGLGGEFFYAAKVADAMAVVEAAKKYSNLTVTAISAPSIMMAKMAVMVNYESKLEPIDVEAGKGMTDMDAQGSIKWKRVFRSQANSHYRVLLRESAARIVRKEIAAMSKAAKRCNSQGDWEQAIDEFYADHAPYVARNLAVSESAAAVYVQEQREALQQYGAGTMEDWETRRVEDLVKLVGGGNYAYANANG